MAIQKAVVLVTGELKELPSGDSLSGVGFGSTTNVQVGLFVNSGARQLVVKTNGYCVIAADAENITALTRLHVQEDTNGDTAHAYFRNIHATGGVHIWLDKGSDASNVRGVGHVLAQSGTLKWYCGIPRRGGSGQNGIYVISSFSDISSGGAEFVLNANGNITIGGGWTFNDLARLSVVGSNASKQVLVVKMAASQSANAIEVQDSSATVLSKFKTTGALEVPDAAYDATTWNGSAEVPTKNAIRDKIETIIGRMASFYASAPVDGTIPLISSARFACTIQGIYNLKTSSGTVTAAIQINGTNVTSLSSLSVTSTPQSPTASGAFTVAVGDRVTLVLSSASTPVDLEFTLGMSV